MMIARLLIYMLAVTLFSSCAKDESEWLNFHFQTEFAPAEQPLENVWILSGEWAGYMGIAIGLSSNRYYYWFYSDVVLSDEPVYPIVGDYSFDGKVLALKDEENRLYSTEWIVTTNAGRACLWAKRDVGKLDRLLLPDYEFDSTDPFQNQGIKLAEP